MVTKFDREMQEIVDLTALAGKKVPEIVIWVSQHKLRKDQEDALLYLHSGRIWLVPMNIIFRDSGHLAETIRDYSQVGKVYVVAPKWQINDIQSGRHGTDLIFRTFPGYIDTVTQEYVFLGVDEIYSDSSVLPNRLFRASDLNWQRGRLTAV